MVQIVIILLSIIIYKFKFKYVLNVFYKKPFRRTFLTISLLQLCGNKKLIENI